MSEIRLHNNRYWKLLRFLLGSASFVFGAVWMFISEPSVFHEIAAIIAIGFFGLSSLLFLQHLFDRRHQICISEAGIWDRTNRRGLIKWEHIERAYPNIKGPRQTISLKLAKGTKYTIPPRRWIPSFNNSTRLLEVNLHLSFIKINPEKLADLINLLSRTDKDLRTYVIRHWNPD